MLTCGMSHFTNMLPFCSQCGCSEMLDLLSVGPGYFEDVVSKRDQEELCYVVETYE